jgi:hypothetical protein
MRHGSSVSLLLLFRLQRRSLPVGWVMYLGGLLARAIGIAILGHPCHEGSMFRVVFFVCWDSNCTTAGNGYLLLER